MERRDFVKALAGGTAMTVIMSQNALASKIAYRPNQGCSTNWQKVHQLMKEKQLPALIIKIGNDTQTKSRLQPYFNDSNKVIQELMSTHIVICMSDYYCNQIFKDMGAKNVAVISPDMKSKEYFELPMDSTSKGNDVLVSLKKIVYGKDLERIRKQDESLAKQMTAADKEAVKTALVQLDAESYKERRKGRIYLTQNLNKAYAAVILCQYNSKSVEVVESCREILRSKANREKCTMFGKTLLNPVVYNHYGVKCGMASMPAGSREFISQL